MIRSSNVSIKQANLQKQLEVQRFIDEYKKVTQLFVDILWEMEHVPTLIPKELTSTVETWLSARAIQCSAKQASGVVRGTRKKQKDRLYRIKQLNIEGKFKQARKLQLYHDKTACSKPNLKTCQPELDSRFVQIDFNPSTSSFDSWITISSIGNSLKLILPIKKQKHFNELLSKGTLKGGIRLSNSSVNFMIEIPDPEPKALGQLIGIDVGQKSILTVSDGTTVDKDKHNHTYQTICNKLARKKKGSKAFKRAQNHRKNFIGWALNQIKWSDVKQINCENIKNLRYKKVTSKGLRHWNYKELFDELEHKCEENGVQILKLNPTYTSQRCSTCGWVQKKNRHGKQFKCASCGFTADADLNASINISLPLMELTPKQQWSSKANRTGFYWLLKSEELIVPHTQKSLSLS
jgi:putative transposase